MEERVLTALEGAFPGRAVERVEPAEFSWNVLTETVRVAFADGESCYLKVATDGDGTRIARERAVLEYVAANDDLPVPHVLACDPDASPPYLATAAVDGETLVTLWADADRETRTALARELGRALAAVHAHRFDRHGRIVGGGADGLELREAPWTDVLLDRIADLRAVSSSDQFDHHFDDVRAAVAARQDLLDDAPAALLHGDPWGPNCFRTAAGVGFLDWEIAHVGDPGLEVYATRDQQLSGPREDTPERLVKAFEAGYRAGGGTVDDGSAEGGPRNEGFAVRRPVYEAVHFLGYSGFFDEMVEYGDDSPAELADWLQTEMDRRLASI